VWWCGVDYSGSEQCAVADCYENSGEFSCSLKGGEFIYQLSDFQILKEDCAAFILLFVLW
jgi:hypothetical protein